jgi:hypothetical protein
LVIASIVIYRNLYPPPPLSWNNVIFVSFCGFFASFSLFSLFKRKLGIRKEELGIGFLSAFRTQASVQGWYRGTEPAGKTPYMRLFICRRALNAKFTFLGG